MKKSIRSRRAHACPETDGSRIRRSLIESAASIKAARQNVTRKPTAPSREGASSPASAAPTSPALPMSTIAPSRKSGSAALLELFGHKPSCAELSRAGLVASCDCKPSPMHDPAVVVGVVMHYARLAMAQRAALPTLIVELLTVHVEAGDPACVMVAEWLDRSGLLDLPIPSVPGRRIRS